MKKTVWVIDDDDSIRWVLDKALGQAGIPIKAFDSADEAMHLFPNELPLTVLSDIRMPGSSGLDFLKKIQTEFPQIPVIIMTAHSDLDSAVNSFELGAYEYLAKPFDIDEVVNVVQRAISSRSESDPEITNQITPSGEILGSAPAMQEVFKAIGRLSSSSFTVLINGESGSGKELVARALHTHGPRKNEVFVALNVAAIPRELIESELFGHEKGSFTGATSARVGRFEQANRGTLFLDEIGDMPISAQTRLLRVIADNSFYRVGGRESVKTNVRILAATHQDLELLVRQGKFREDLFHRLNVIRINVPSLSERREDIPLLAAHFLKKLAEESEEERKILDKSTEDYLCNLPWPGNVRQLENLCQWLHVMSSSTTILVEDLPKDLLKTVGNSQGDNWESNLSLWANEMLEKSNSKPLLDIAMPKFEKIIIEAALRKTKGRKKDAAQLLGWGRNTLTRKLQEIGLSKDNGEEP